MRTDKVSATIIWKEDRCTHVLEREPDVTPSGELFAGPENFTSQVMLQKAGPVSVSMLDHMSHQQDLPFTGPKCKSE
jgi:hypothetical protein